MLNITKILRKRATNKFISELGNQKNIINLTLVGSFIDKNDLDKINDIDLIVIINKLNRNNFNKIVNKVKKIKPKDLISKKNRLYVNSTFGPLKFNKNKNDLVIHLMIYDLDGHINHCVKSPFTVFDWERSKFFFRKQIKDIFSVGTLQLRDFIEGRRGVKNYLNDLINKKISYREYKFHRKKYITVSKNIHLSDRDKFEFYFHIIKNLILNFIKFFNKKNKLYLIKKNDKQINKYFGKKFYIKNIKNINLLLEKKKYLNYTLDKKFDKWMLKFIEDYSRSLNILSKNSKKVFFFRHAKTKLNDGSFLGQSRDPSILKQNKKIKKQNFSAVYTSPLKRCKETVKILSLNNNYMSDQNLLEIDYGEAEGMKFIEFEKKFPHIKKQWSQNKDPKFPKGESLKDIYLRVQKFLKKLIKNSYNKSCIITHNVFLRVLIGESFNIPKEKWHQIYIPHLMKLEFLIINRKLYPNIERGKLKEIFSNLN